MISKMYIDTSVFGGLFDIEFSKETSFFFEKLLESEIKILISDLLELELLKAPEKIIEFYESIPESKKIQIYRDGRVRKLAQSYINEGVVGKTSLADCEHIALATIEESDVLVSWNFKHIVNLERIIGYNSINLRDGFRNLEIRTPKEIF